MKFVDLEFFDDPGGTDVICSLLEEALEHIDNAGSHFVAIVRNNVRAVVREELPRPIAVYFWRVYKAAFPLNQRNDTKRLAADLVRTGRFLEVMDSATPCTYLRTLADANRQADGTRDWFTKLIATPIGT